MKVLVSIKRAIDYNVHIRLADDGTGVITEGVKHSINPFDEIALEEAIRWKEAGKVTEVVAVTIGPAPASDQLRSALAFGCDRALHVTTDEPVSSLAVARVLARLATDEAADVLLFGKQAIDDDNGQAGPMTAALLDWPQATFASNIMLDDDSATVTREVDSGLETLAVDLPAVITADLRLNEPRYLKLPNIMKAKKKPIEQIALDSLALDTAMSHRIVETRTPAGRPPGERVDSVEALVALLKERGHV